MATDITDRVFTVPEAARLLGISDRLAYAAAARGEIPALRIGRRLVVPGVALARLLEGGEPMAIRRLEQDEDGATGGES
jgi:excisionase family DNA binding protein